MSAELMILLSFFRRVKYKVRRRWRKIMRYWDRVKWCLIGGFGYAAARLLINWVQEFLP